MREGLSGERVGVMLNALLRAVAAGDVENSAEALEAYVRDNKNA